MTQRDDEEALLRSVALQNAKAILQARQQAEQALLEANRALELKTAELAQSLAMMRATLESTTDGILVTDAAGNITGFNEKFLSMWRLPPAVMNAGTHHAILDIVAQQFADPQAFRAACARDLCHIASRELRLVGALRRAGVRAVFAAPDCRRAECRARLEFPGHHPAAPGAAGAARSIGSAPHHAVEHWRRGHQH